MKTVIGALTVFACMIAMCYGFYQEGKFAERWDETGRETKLKGIIDCLIKDEFDTVLKNGGTIFLPEGYYTSDSVDLHYVAPHEEEWKTNDSFVVDTSMWKFGKIKDIDVEALTESN